MYSRLPTENNEAERSELPTSFKTQSNTSALFRVLRFACPASLLLVSFVLGRWSVSLNDCGKMLSTWSPALGGLDHYQTMLDVSVYNSLSESKFRGPPSEELDAAWDSIANQDLYVMRMEKQDLQRINRTDAEDTAFGWEGDSDGVRMIPEVFHELHCLNTLRKYTWPEHYQLVPEKFKDDPVYVELYKRDHIDHCLEWLRQTIMCTSDVTPILATKPEDGKGAQPDFRQMRTCRNFERLQDYVTAHAIPLEGTPVDHHRA